MKSGFRFLIGVVGVFLVSATACVHGEVIFDNTGFIVNGYQAVQPQDSVSSGSYAQAFSTTDSSIITDISLLMLNTNALTDFSIDIFSSISSLPGSHVADVFSGVSGTFSAPRNFSGLNISLAPNTQYFVVASVDFGALGWAYTNATVGLNAYNYGTGWVGTIESPLQMSITAVPEPGTSAMLGLLLLGGASAAIRRMRAKSAA